MEKITDKRWLKVCMLFFVVLLPVFLGSCGGSQNEPIWNISGTKNVFQTTLLPSPGPLDVPLGVFTFTQSVNTVTGTTPQTQGINGTVSGSDITFTFIGADLVTTYTYNGIISGGGVISGTWTATNGQSGTWRTTAAA